MNFDTLWNALPMPGFLIDGDNRILAVNSAGEGFVVASSKSLTGKRCIDKITTGAALEQMFARVRTSNSPLSINDVKAGPTNQTGVRCNIQITPVSVNQPLLLLLISPRDGRKQIKRAGSAKSVIGMAEMLAHEIKNPLAGITGAAQLLAMSLPKADLEMTDLIVSEVRRVVSLLDQVEQFGNLSPPDCKAVNIHDVLDRARKSAALGFAAHMKIDLDYDPSLPDTWADADQLIQVVLNLLKNAAQVANKAGGKIIIRSAFDNSMRLRRSDGTAKPLPILLEIIDDGPGISPEITSDIFAPFVSGRENGTGLGLALVSKIIADHHGWIGVDSRPGRTVFRVYLPKIPAPKRSL
jgi:two-component system nitrogen regulation sensor histidine kinase GlnL